MRGITMALLSVLTMGSQAVGAPDELVASIRVYAPNSQDPIDEGSGFLVSANGHIVTARHVVKAALEINATIKVALRYKENTSITATVFRCDPAAKYPDACIIRISPDAVKAHNLVQEVTRSAKIACRDLRTQERLTALGYAEGEHNTLFRVGGDVIGGLGMYDLYPSSLPLTYGMSGGPVLDTQGNIVGIVAGGSKKGTHGYFTPLTQISARLLEANVPCPAPLPDHDQSNAGVFSLAKLTSAELQVSSVDDVVTVSINGRQVEKASFGDIKPWRDIKPYLKAGPNGILVDIYNGEYGGCGAVMQVRLNGKPVSELNRRWFVPMNEAPYKGNCAREVLTLNIEP